MRNTQCFQTAYQDPNSVIFQAYITEIFRTPLNILIVKLQWGALEDENNSNF